MILAKNPYSLLLAIGIIASWFLQASLAQELDLVNITTSYDLASIFEEAGEVGTALKRLGALKFLEFDDGRDDEYLCMVTNAERNNAAVYCMDVVRDPADGKLVGLKHDGKGPIEIQNFDGSTVLSFSEELSHSFTPGPGGFDYMASSIPGFIHVVEWSRANDGRPKLNMIHQMRANVGFSSVAFSNIVQDPETRFGMMFGAVAGGHMVEIPLVPTTLGPNVKAFDIDQDNILFLCSGMASPMGSLKAIATGPYTNDFVGADFKEEGIFVLDIDDKSGYPVGVTDSSRIPFVDNIGNLPNVQCQVQDFISTDPYRPWASVFDQKTGDYLLLPYATSKLADAILYQVGTEGGFAPGFDSSVVKANLVSVFNDLVELSKGVKRKLRNHLRRLPAGRSKSEDSDKESTSDVQCEFAKTGELLNCRNAIRGIRKLFTSKEYLESVSAGEASPALIVLTDSLKTLAFKGIWNSFSGTSANFKQHVLKGLIQFGQCLLDIVQNMGDPENTPSCSVP